MKLYHRVERVFNELAALGVAPRDGIDVEQLTAFDQYHYLGTEAVDEAAYRLVLDDGSDVLEVGSGIGGPARHLAHRVGCRVTALELQPDLHEVAVELTRRCGLAERVAHLCGDILDGVDSHHDAVVSWLAFLHIPERPALYARCFDALRPGGGRYAEDFFARGRLTDAERETLARELSCEHVPNLAQYRDELSAAGFEGLELTDMTPAWTDFVAQRRAGFRARRERHVAVHGEAIVDGLDEFYTLVADLFRGGNLGGIRLVARKPG